VVRTVPLHVQRALHVFNGPAGYWATPFDYAGDLLSGLTGMFGQLAHFVSDDRESPPIPIEPSLQTHQISQVPMGGKKDVPWPHQV